MLSVLEAERIGDTKYSAAERFLWHLRVFSPSFRLFFGEDWDIRHSSSQCYQGQPLSFTAFHFPGRLTSTACEALSSCTLGIIGLCIIGFLHTPTPRYVGSFHGQCGTNGLIVTGLAGVKTT